MGRRAGAVPAGCSSMMWRSPLAGCIALAAGFLSQSARADTLPDALVRTYQGNPQINAERARQRATDESVPQALSGYRPQVVGTLSYGLALVRTLLPDNTVQTGLQRPWTIGLTVTQTLFNGFRTANTVRQAESQVRSGREALRNVGQNVLLDGVTIYTDVLAYQGLVEAQQANVAALGEVLRTTRERLRTGDVTPTDVAQGEARFNRGRADLNAAEVNLAVSQANYARIIGTAPGRLAPAEPIERLLPRTREEAYAASRREHPAILGAQYDVDTAQFAISIAESSLWPQVSVQGNVSRNSNTDQTFGSQATDQASIVAQATVPIYDGGLAASQVRQNKSLREQSRLVLDIMRSQTQTAVSSAWAVNEGARVAVEAGQAEVSASQLVLTGVQQRRAGGAATVLEVLNAQQELVGARARLIQAQRDRVVASYTLLSALGRLDVKTLGLKTPDYLPDVHYHQVRDAWHGLRTPSGQ